MKRILILGSPGSGKSTFSKKLQQIVGLPLFHLDNIWWKPDMSHISRDEFDEKLEEILKKDAWIIDGDYSRTYEPRIRACDTIVFLDYDEDLCIEGIKGRVGEIRDDIPWVEETLDPELLAEVETYAQLKRPRVLELKEQYPEKKWIVFRCREEADDWFRELTDRENRVRKIEIVGQNFSGEVKGCRRACRAVILKDDQILMTCLTKTGVWMLPGGGQYQDEDEKECVIRETVEETGCIIRPSDCVLEIDEYYEEWKYVSRYFLGEIAGQTQTLLTVQEKELGLCSGWIAVDEIMDIFLTYPEYENDDEMRRGLYLREYTALRHILNK